MEGGSGASRRNGAHAPAQGLQAEEPGCSPRRLTTRPVVLPAGRGQAGCGPQGLQRGVRGAVLLEGKVSKRTWGGLGQGLREKLGQYQSCREYPGQTANRI